jgi:hypothetical protein
VRPQNVDVGGQTLFPTQPLKTIDHVIRPSVILRLLLGPLCTENLIRIFGVTESAKLAR